MYKGLLVQQGRMTGMEGGVHRGKGGGSKNWEQSRVGEGAVKLSIVRGVYNGDRYHSRGGPHQRGARALLYKEEVPCNEMGAGQRGGCKPAAQ